MIGIIDYGMGNLGSVQKALQHLKAEAVILSTPQEAPLDRLSKLVLPGVGAFADGMAQLHERGWTPFIRDFVQAANPKPFLGICLGMQLLFEGSEEDAPADGELVPGLGVLPGKAVRFRSEVVNGRRLKVPHMGWNTLTWTRPDPLLEGLEQGDAVYFVHSYFVEPTDTPDQPLTSARSDYGRPFCASIWRGRIWATQFHPEKSQRVGLRILENFVKL